MARGDQRGDQKGDQKPPEDKKGGETKEGQQAPQGGGGGESRPAPVRTVGRTFWDWITETGNDAERLIKQALGLGTTAAVLGNPDGAKAVAGAINTAGDAIREFFDTLTHPRGEVATVLREDVLPQLRAANAHLDAEHHYCEMESNQPRNWLGVRRPARRERTNPTGRRGQRRRP